MECVVCGEQISDGEKPKKSLCGEGRGGPVHVACHWRCKSCPDRIRKNKSVSGGN